jgi:F-type H+-transporting ATPase subunit b
MKTRFASPAMNAMNAKIAGLLAGMTISTLALAAEEGHEAVGAIPTAQQGLWTGITALIVFGIAAAVLGLFVWPKISSGLDERAQKIKDEIEAAEMARSQAKDALEQYQLSLSQARAEAQKEIDKARSQAQAISDELKQKADVELSAMREKALRDIEQAKRSAVAEVYAVSGNLATSMAGKILRREVNAGDTQRLMDESLAQMSSTRN